MRWHSAIEYCEQAERKQDDAVRKKGRIGCKETIANYLKKAAAAAAAAGFRKKEAAAVGGGEEEVEEREKNRRVAIALSRYCAYLLVSAPELIPRRAVETERNVDAKCHLGDLLLGRVRKADIHKFFREAQEPLAVPPGVRRCSDHWKVLALVWVRMLVYAAPYGNADVHTRHLSLGGELITHLWALLYHLNIRYWKEMDEKHVVALNKYNFFDLISTRRHVMVTFYHPSWGESQELAPEYAAAAAYLAAQKADVVLGKVDTTNNSFLADQYRVKEFLTILFFVDGVPSPYTGANTKIHIVEFINENSTPWCTTSTTSTTLKGYSTGLMAMLWSPSSTIHWYEILSFTSSH